MDKDKLIQKYWNINVEHNWWEHTYGDFARLCDTLGLTLEGKPSFSGFSRQGDGACFTGSYRAYGVLYREEVRENYSETAPHKVREYAPEDKELHRIADELCLLSRIYYPVYARITHTRTRGIATPARWRS